ncbi:MAG: hypothetical protein IPO61_07475 [Gammaproteobacteria bacterium]|nr:hypothetical protein [Gammaproteobacteria bacterium]
MPLALPLRQWVVSFPFKGLRFLLLPPSPEALAKALEVIYSLLVTHLAHKAGFRCKEVATQVRWTLVQRFGSALNLNIHLHHAWPRRRVRAAFGRRAALQAGEGAEREEGPLEHPVQQDRRSGWGVGAGADGAVAARCGECASLRAAVRRGHGCDTPALGSSVTYRIAVGLQAGRSALVLRTITALAGEEPRNERWRRRTAFPYTPA